VEDADHEPDNPYTAVEGYGVHDASGEEAGGTVYDYTDGVIDCLGAHGRGFPPSGWR